jgi:uncharacterized repeat protein (TIGR03803 family)
MLRSCRLSILAVFFALAIATSIPAHAQTYEVIHNFGNGTDGSQPEGAIYTDSAGNIYGATYAGGTSQGGVIYQIDQSGNETILHNFDLTQGTSPGAALSFFNGTWLFGDTFGVSAFGDNGSDFALRLSPPVFKTVHSFSGTDGRQPDGTLVLSADKSTAYGITYYGGANKGGTAYKIDVSGNVSLIHSFPGYSGDGLWPTGGLFLDPEGNLYGVTATGGSNDYGVLFRVDPSGNETVIHNFDWDTGAQPGSAPLGDGMGNVYGTTQRGGPGGVLYRVNLSMGSYTIVHQFQIADGIYPHGNLVKDGSGHLYGVTYDGGSGNCNCGTIYQMDTSGSVKVLHSFTGNPDGRYGNWLHRDPATGILYGTTQNGGTYGEGVLFRITP